MFGARLGNVPTKKQAPCDLIADSMEKLNENQRAYAKRCGIHFQLLNHILKARKGVSATTALKIQKATRGTRGALAAVDLAPELQGLVESRKAG